MRTTVLLILLVALGISGSMAAEPPGDTASGREIFARLGKLIGSWSGTTASGRTHAVNFRYTAAGTVLVETWTLGAGRESMTLYALDGERLLATHYCPQGNQPRLEYSGTDAAGRAQFRFIDGTNLHVAGHSHQQAFWIRIDNEQAFSRSETYVENDTPPDVAEADEAVRYARVTD